MDSSIVRDELDKMTMTFSSQIFENTLSFLHEHMEPIWRNNPHLHVPAAAAIMCETTKLPTIGNLSYTGTGTKIENVMRHLSGLGKQQFLEAIDFQINKWNGNNHALVEKVQDLKISLRSFKKYKEIFEHFASKTHQEFIPSNIREDLLGLFWVIYLLLKHSLRAVEDITMSTKILIVLLEQIFSSTISKFPIQMVTQYISENQYFASIAQSETTVEEKTHFQTEYEKLLRITLSNRNATHSFTKEGLKENTFILKRLVDDLSNIYEKIYDKLPAGRYIDEITYLELSKDLTPQVSRFKASIYPPIQKVLNFDEEDESEESDKGEDSFQITEDQNSTIRKVPVMRESPDVNERKKSPEKALSHLFSSATFGNIPPPPLKLKPAQPLVAMSPLTWGVTKSAWIKKIIQEYSEMNEEKMEKIFEDRLINFMEFKEFAKKKISEQVESLTSHSLDKDSQKMGIWKVFISLSVMIEEKHGIPKNRSILFVRSLLCLSGCLYNYTMRSLSIEFQKYCSIYELDLQEGFQVIYSIGKHLQIPNFIKEYLYQLEKQIVIKEMWDSECGFTLLLEKENEENQIVFKRLFRHIYERIKDLCESINVDLILVKKIEHLIKQILEERLVLLKGNKLDQIIICSIAACLSLNEQKNSQALSTIFHKYAYTPQAVSLESMSSQGKEMTLIQYYNNAFLPEVQEMMQKSERKEKFLYTPIRESQLRMIKEGKLKLPPISKIGSAPFGSGGALRLGKSSGFRQQVEKKAFNRLKENFKESPRKDDVESPSFGTTVLKRTMTFGNGQL